MREVEANARKGTTAKIQALWRMLVFLCDYWNTRWIPFGLALPSLHTHRSETENRDRAVAIRELDPRSDLRSGIFDVHSRIDPLLSRKRETQRVLRESRVVAIVRWIACVALS